MSSVFSIAQSQKAAVVSAYGPSKDVIKVVPDYAVPVPGPNEVLVKVKYASINPIDYKILTGHYHAFFPRTFPSIPGFDIAGVVAAKGASVPASLPLGARVFGSTFPSANGGYAEYALASADRLFLIPDSVDFKQAAAITIVGATAIDGLVTYPSLKAGQRVLIMGGAGGVGHIAIQLAKKLGAYVYTTASAASKSFIESLPTPPDVIIDRNSQDFVTILSENKVDVVFDTIGSENWEAAQKILVKGGYYTSVDPSPKPDGENAKYKGFMCNTGAPNLELLAGYLRDRTVVSSIARVFTFTQEEVVALFEASESSKTRGKLLLEVDATA